METRYLERDALFCFSIPGDISVPDLCLVRRTNLPVVALDCPDTIPVSAMREIAVSLLSGYRLTSEEPDANLSIFPTVNEPGPMLTTYMNFFDAAAGTLRNFVNLLCVSDFLIHYIHPAMQHTTNILTRHHT